MRRRQNIALDFTSLLDVILIILFIVIGSMNQASIDAGKASAQAVANAQIRIEDLEKDNGQLHNELDEARAELAMMKAEIEYDPGDAENTFDLLRGITKVVLDCSTSIDPAVKNSTVTIRISVIRNGGQEQTDLEVVSLLHDHSLSGAEREQLRSEQVQTLANVLIDGLRQDAFPVFWLTIQYDYDDIHFTYSDINVIQQAVDIAQLQLEKTFYVDEYHKI